MSRSFNKLPISGNTTAESEKNDKRFANRSARAAMRLAIKSLSFKDADGLVIPDVKEVSDVWTFAKDGKRYFTGAFAGKVTRK